MKVNAIILAAGNGTRMNSSIPKVMQEIAGESLLKHVTTTAENLGCSTITTIISPSIATDYLPSLQQLTKCDFNTITQPTPTGTAAAVNLALPQLNGEELALIMYGDVPCISQQDYQYLIDNYQPNSIGILTAEHSQPQDLGRIIRDKDQKIIAIREACDASASELAINEVNTGIILAKVSDLQKSLNELSTTNNNNQQEFYLTDCIAWWHTNNLPIYGVKSPKPHLTLGANTMLQLYQLESNYFKNRAQELTESGVYVLDHSSLYLYGNVKISPGVKIGSQVEIHGPTTISSGVTIANNVKIIASTIGENTKIDATCVISHSKIAENASIGPFTHLRPGSDIGPHCKIGSFVEIKASSIARATKVNHFAYIGDAQIGSEVNWGGFTVTCNYDGLNKHKTTIGSNSFIGSGCQLIAPLTVGDSAFLAAGSTYSKDIKDKQHVIARSRQQTLERK